MSASLTKAQLDAIREALVAVLPSRGPADVALKFYFRNHRQLGARDRALVADTVYSVLRHRRLLEAVTPSASPRELALASLVKFQGFGVGPLEPALRPEEHRWLTAQKARDLEDLPFDMDRSVPDAERSSLHVEFTSREPVFHRATPHAAGLHSHSSRFSRISQDAREAWAAPRVHVRGRKPSAKGSGSEQHGDG